MTHATTAGALACADPEARRTAILASATTIAIDWLEVRTAPPADNQRVLELHFITGASTATLHGFLDALVVQPQLLRLLAPESRNRRPRIVAVARVGEVLEVHVDHPGDFTTYELVIQQPTGAGQPKIDVVLGRIAFTFKAGCPTRFDCCPPEHPETLDWPGPAIDYLAKDYRSFREAILDRLALLLPGWAERHEADLTVMLAELLAYAGDQLSYQQDAVANEAFLATARQRPSVRRHARLLGEQLDEGLSARAYAVCTVNAPCVITAGTELLTRTEVPFRDATDTAIQPPLPTVLVPKSPDEADRLRDVSTVFEVRTDVRCSKALNELTIYDWGLVGCELPAGTTSAHLTGNHTAVLKAGALLLLEETRGRASGLPADADPVRRHVVRLTKVVRTVDPLKGQSLTRVTWAPEDALPMGLCVNRLDDDGIAQAMAVARGNVLLVDQGRRREQWWPATAPWVGTPPIVPPPGIVRGQRTTRFLLERGPLSRWRHADDHTALALLDASAPETMVTVRAFRTPSEWIDFDVAGDLIEVGPSKPAIVAEDLDDGRAFVRFGDGEHGVAPPEGSYARATTRTGRGSAGNVGIDAISHILHTETGAPPKIELIRNPIPAKGGRDPETLDAARARLPVAFRAPLRRAVTAADYVTIARRHDGVADAAARLRWTGSWLTAFVFIDPVGRTELDPALAADIHDYVAAHAIAGYDVEIVPPRYAALDLELFVCVRPDRFREHVEEELLVELGNGRRSDGRPAFFHPDRFGFGDPLYLSALYAAANAVPGVASIEARRFSRLHDDDPLPSRPVTTANVDAGVLAIGELEVLEVANDPSLIERGLLTITTGGGR